VRNKQVLAIVALLAFASGAVMARPTLILEVDNQKLTVRFENDQVRVLELRLKPGEAEGFHSHPQYLLYALTDYRVKNTATDGTSKIFERKAGDIFWGEPITHRGENVGNTEVLALIIELKQR
jgi:beta-alanine degradation protein BauB